MISEAERQRRAENMRRVNARKPRKDEAYYREFIKARLLLDEALKEGDAVLGAQADAIVRSATG